MELFKYLGQGLLLGLAMGILPGPVMAIIIAQTLQEGFWGGIKVSIGSLVLDILKVSLVFFLFSFLPNNPLVFAIIGLVGACFLLYLASSIFMFQPNTSLVGVRINSLFLGIVSNFLNPSLYIFWLTVGGPIILAARVAGGISAAIWFISGFLSATLIINILVVVIAGQMEIYLEGKYYIYVLRLVALSLVVFAFLFLRQSFHYFWG